MTDPENYPPHFKDLRRRAEAEIEAEPIPPEELSPEELSPDQAVRLIHQLRVYQIELEMQNEDLRQAQVQLAESRDKYAELYDFAPVGYLTLNGRGQIAQANLTAATLLGVERSKIYEVFFSHFLEATDRPVFRQLLKTCLFERKQRGEFRFKNGNGDLRIMLLDILSHQDGEGRERCFLAMTEITDLKRVQEELRQSEQNYRIVADFTYDWEFWLNSDGTLRYCSPSCERISGRKPEEFLQQPDLLREIIVPEDKETWDTHVCNTRDNPAPRDFQFRILKPDGQIRWIEHCCQPVTDKLGGYLGVRASNRDVTDRKESESKLEEALANVERLKNQLEADYNYLQEEIKFELGFDQIIGQSEALKRVLVNVQKVAPSDTTVLILGETGTGKEIIARAIHSASPRAHRPLVKVDCAALSPSLIESELFGHEKGAFTGASTRKLGRFELAHGGTIFLDEIGELALPLQAKLLRLIQDGEFERLGSTRTQKVNVRIIAATNRDLEEEVKRGAFREDLWYRLHIYPLTLPPLRQRIEDIPALALFFLNRSAKKMGKDVRKIPARVMEALQSYPWPGNVRELENVIERAVINTQGPYLQLAGKVSIPPAKLPPEPARQSLAARERDHILQILQEADWKIEGKDGAAARLGLNPSTLRGRMRKLGITRNTRQS